MLERSVTNSDPNHFPLEPLAGALCVAAEPGGWICSVSKL